MGERNLRHDLGSVISTLKVAEAAIREKDEEIAELVAAALERLLEISDSLDKK